MEQFDPNKIISREYIIDSVEDILYKVGLQIRSLSGSRYRKWFYSPKIVFTFLSLHLLKDFVILLSEDNERTKQQVLGDVGNYFGIRFHFTSAKILTVFIALNSQLYYYWNHKRGIEPTFLNIFRVIAGSATPSSVGITDKRDIKYLNKLCKLVKIVELNNIANPFFGFLFQFTAYYYNMSLINMLLIV